MCYIVNFHYVEFSIAVMLLSLLGKTLITLAYAVVYLHGSEIFPTEVRNVGLGVASTIEGIGAMVAPPIGGPMVTYNDVTQYHQSINQFLTQHNFTQLILLY